MHNFMAAIEKPDVQGKRSAVDCVAECADLAAGFCKDRRRSAGRYGKAG